MTAAQFEDYWARDPLPREREVFGGSGEECPVLGGVGLPEDPDGVIVSDRYKLLRMINSPDKVGS